MNTLSIRKKISRSAFWLASLWAGLILCFNTGCASGGFKMTREYAGFVNRQNILFRVILYVLGFVVFVVTLVLDVVLFNTMDFWEGRVSEGTYHFENETESYVVQHRFIGNDKLKESKITITAKKENTKQTQEIVLRETVDHHVEVYTNGVLKAKVSDIYGLPIMSRYNEEGKEVDRQLIQLPTQTLNLAKIL